jgi:hypothetical protein
VRKDRKNAVREKTAGFYDFFTPGASVVWEPSPSVKKTAVSGYFHCFDCRETA